MGVLYLIDAHNPVLLDSEINDTIPVETGDTQNINGSFPVNVPFGVPIDGTPANITELLTQKFAGLLAFYPGYTYINYDEGIDLSGWDAANSTGVGLGSRGTTHIADGGLLRSNSVSLSGSDPTQAITTWEVYEVTGFSTENDKDGAKVRRYEEADPSDLLVTVSFNNGAGWTVATDGVQFNVAVSNRGTDCIIRMSNSSGKRLWVGSWAVIY